MNSAGKIEGTPTEEGKFIFTVKASNYYGDYTKELSIEISPLGIEDILQNNLFVYPNPTTGKFTITNYKLRISNVEVFDIYGRNVSNLISHSSNHQMDISNLPAGIYFVKMNTEKGIIVKKIVKQ
jgi:hypothetical protein